MEGVESGELSKTLRGESRSLCQFAAKLVKGLMKILESHLKQERSTTRW